MKKQNNAPIIGGRLLQARKIKGLTARCVAETIGVSAQAISLYENSYSQPNPETFEKMMPQRLEALERYLGNGMIKGVGKAP